MKSSNDERFREEAARFGLRFGCEDCAHFDEARDACVHGYPTAEHRRSALGEGDGSERSPWVVFCKEFILR